MALQTPTPKLVDEACAEFNNAYEVIEQALTDLFGMYSTNNNRSHVLLKVAALNSLYRTQMYAFDKVADHISNHAKEIDEALAAGTPELVDKIARIEIGGKTRVNYSFATKYCSWHRPDIYPIWDSRVDLYLWRLQKQDPFTSKLKFRQDLWGYRRFRDIIGDFRDHYGLGTFSFKQVDKFLFTEGEKLMNSDTTIGTHSDPQ